MGCCLNPGFICNCNMIDFPIKLSQFSFPTIPLTSLTDEEKELLRKLGECWNLFISLDKRSSTDITEFIDSIHRCQQIVALRVARRVDPEVWAQPE